MADIVNLKLARKRKDRAAKEVKAEENRIRFGRTKAERELEAKKAELAARRLDGHERGE